MKYNCIYDSSRTSCEKNITMEREHYDSPIVPFYVLFQQEAVYLEADANGNAAIFDLEGGELFRAKADGKGRYFAEFYCKVEDGVISIRFPIQEIVDHYPHCDGENDRYSYITKENIVYHYCL